MTSTPITPNSRLLAHLSRVGHVAVGLVFVGMMSFPEPALGAAADITNAHYAANVLRDARLAAVGQEQQSTAAVAGAVSTDSLRAGARIPVTATAYSASVSETDANPQQTASGTVPGPGTVAANFLPFGSTIRIGSRTYTVVDRLHSRFNGHYVIDVWFPGQEEARAFGVRRIEIVVISVPR